MLGLVHMYVCVVHSIKKELAKQLNGFSLAREIAAAAAFMHKASRDPIQDAAALFFDPAGCRIRAAFTLRQSPDPTNRPRSLCV